MSLNAQDPGEPGHFDFCDPNDCGGRWHDCWNCGGEGRVESDDWQDGDWKPPCDQCKGEGGWPCPYYARMDGVAPAGAEE